MKRQTSGSQKSINQINQINQIKKREQREKLGQREQLERVVLGTVAYADELLKLGERYPKAVVQEEMFDGSNIIRVDPDLLDEEIRKEGSHIVIEVIPGTLALFMGIALSDMQPEETLAAFQSRTENLLLDLLGHQINPEYRILTSRK